MDGLLERFQKHQDWVFVIGVIAIMFTIFLPMPPAILDFLLVGSITVGIMVLLTVVYIREPLHFSAFPSVLLMTTAYRLALNVATTRQILGNAGTEGTQAAGKVIASFGNFVAGSEPLIGFIIFLILVIVNFVVISKGATRVSEVAARFTLDAMPGKQMAIDADLNAGLINETDARQRREDISKQADFYGAMDGATKFVRGDAIAGIIITIINILAGLIIGVANYDMTINTALYTFTIMTIGDGLVSQVPALVISLAAGLIVTRATAESNLGKEIMGQVFLGDPKKLLVAGGFLFVLVLTAFFGSGMPWLQMSVLAAIMVGGFVLLAEADKKKRVQKVEEAERAASAPKPEKVEPLLHVDPMELEIGYGLIRLVDPAQGGTLLDRVTSIRRQTAVELGLVVPPVRIRDNLQLEPNQYIIKIRGTEFARGIIQSDQYLAMEMGPTSGPIEGVRTVEPAFGMTAYWITEAQKQRAEAMGYTVVDAVSVLTTHLTEIIKRHAHELLTREETNNLLKNLKERNASLVEEVVPNVLKAGEVQKVLQMLLQERVPIRDLATILETIGDYAPRTKDPEVLVQYARAALSRTITQMFQEKDGRLHVATIDPKLEDLIWNGIERTEHGSRLALPPQQLQAIIQKMSEEVEKMITAGHEPVIFCSPQVRTQIVRLAMQVQADIVVLSYNEVLPETRVEALGVIGLEESQPAVAAT